MTKCQKCKKNEAIWAWQPDGPDETPTATTLGNHYRGFTVVKVCDDCLTALQQPETASE